MTDGKETVDCESFVGGVKHPLGRLADACLCAYEENGDTLLVEAANALRAIETVDLTGVNKCNPCKSLPWHVSHSVANPFGKSLPDWAVDRFKLALKEKEILKSNKEFDEERKLKPKREIKFIINDGSDADDISEVVIECVRNNCHSDTSAFKIAEITRETNLWDDLRLDGLDMGELIMDVEDKLSQLPPYHRVIIPEEVSDGIETVGDLVDAAFLVMGVRI